MARFIAKRVLEHDGRRYEPGADLLAEPAAVAAAVESGALVPADEPVAEKPAKKAAAASKAGNAQ